MAKSVVYHRASRVTAKSAGGRARASRTLYLAAPDLTGNEEAYVVDALRSTRISSTGPYVERFEAEFARFAGTTSVVSVANGTVALHLAILSLGAGPGDEVIVPSLTYVATANAVRYTGAEPVFVDVDPETWCIAPAAVEAAISERTRGIVAVHLYGHPADMDALNALAAARNIWVLEDAAEAHGALYRGRSVGSLGTASTFSFYGNKIITSGEGGAVATSDPELEKRLRLFRGQGMDPERRYYFPVVGYNYRLTNVACALLCAQLERVDEILSWRRALFSAYDERLHGLHGIRMRAQAAWATPAPWLYSVTVDRNMFGLTRDELASRLAADGIETRPFFIPLHTLPPYREAKRLSMLETDRLAKTGLNLPTAAGMTVEDVRFVASAIRAASRA